MKSLKKIICLVAPYLNQHRKQLVVYLLIAMTFFSLNLGQPFLLGQFIDYMMKDLNYANILICCTAFFAVSVLQVIFSYYVKTTGTRLQCSISNDMKIHFFRHFQQTSPRFHMREDVSAMAEKINNDCEYLVIFLLNLGMQFPGKLVCFLCATFYIFVVDVWCGLAVLAFLPVLALLYFKFKDKIYNSARASAQVRTEYFAVLSEQFHEIESIRLNQLGEILAKRFYSIGKKAENLYVDEEKVTFGYGMINSNMDTFLKIFLFAYGGFSVLNGKMTTGQFTILYSYLAIITTSFSYFLSIGQETQQYMAYYSRLKELSDIPKECNGANVPKQLDRISVDNMQFAYAEKNVFDGISLTFEQDKIYCIAGKNGAGKSTLAKLILGLYTDDTGKHIQYNGIPLTEINMYEMRKTHIGVSEQEPVMLNGTVEFNITYSEECVDIGEIKKLMEIVNFCSGENTETNVLLSTDASTLSGGQKQKISIIKALYKSPGLLLLDEPTSALDAVSKQKLVQYLKNTSSGRITILISHDADIIDLADEVISIDNISSS